jgi:uncharacterized integral membrane protein (TIGR00697 family)
MNELTFFLHIIALMSFVLITLRMGKEALTAALVVQIILANLFVTKQMVLFGFNITCSEVYTIGGIFTMNLLQSYYGKKTAHRALLILFFLLFFVLVMGQFHLRYLPSQYDVMHRPFTMILGSTPRIIMTSFCCTLATQKLDIELFGLFKKKLPFFLAFGCGSMISQFLDTVGFSFIALYGVVHSMRDIIFMSYIVKLVVILSVIPFTFLVKKFIRHDPLQV